MSYLAFSTSFEYLCYGSTVIRNILLLLARDRLYTSEADVYRRQILTSKVGPRTERVTTQDANPRAMQRFDATQSDQNHHSYFGSFWVAHLPVKREIRIRI